MENKIFYVCWGKYKLVELFGLIYYLRKCYIKCFCYLEIVFVGIYLKRKFYLVVGYCVRMFRVVLFVIIEKLERV